MCEQIARETFDFCMETGTMPDTAGIVAIMQRSNLYKVKSISTYIHRSSTISGWITGYLV